MAHTQRLSTIFTLLPTNLCNTHPNTPSNSLRLRFSTIRADVSLEEHPFPPNAMRRKLDSSWMGGFSLGIDLGLSRTGLALSKGFSVRPLKVLELRGQKLEMGLLEIAQKQEVDEFIIGLPISSDGKETPQSNKVRSVAGRIAIRAAERWLELHMGSNPIERLCRDQKLLKKQDLFFPHAIGK
ncbi:uncharacterized protein LOC112523146 isoform X2 [Cynara cardunculus var. scolymus]|uniref:uncharacterized protein LOC112523146 isoform X2 n=1 Tax=Cynara cardunculus var. scolymus TaxID=59895 RepID=UPI000D62A347|nr:uncharacterized protein LOC112523146 isoform X2 [Cynara cardunculus var. scolymus]